MLPCIVRRFEQISRVIEVFFSDTVYNYNFVILKQVSVIRRKNETLAVLFSHLTMSISMKYQGLDIFKHCDTTLNHFLYRMSFKFAHCKFLDDFWINEVFF